MGLTSLLHPLFAPWWLQSHRYRVAVVQVYSTHLDSEGRHCVLRDNSELRCVFLDEIKGKGVITPCLSPTSAVAFAVPVDVIGRCIDDLCRAQHDALSAGHAQENEAARDAFPLTDEPNLAVTYRDYLPAASCQYLF